MSGWGTRRAQPLVSLLCVVVKTVVVVAHVALSMRKLRQQILMRAFKLEIWNPCLHTEVSSL